MSTSATDRLTSFLHRRHRLVLLLGVLFAVGCALAGSGTADRLVAGGWYPQSAPALRAERLLGADFAAGSPDLLLKVTADGAHSSVDSPAVRDAGLAAVAEVRDGAPVHYMTSYWTRHDPALRSPDGRSALVAAKFDADEEGVRDAVARLLPAVTGHRSAVTVSAAGPAVVLHAVEDQAHQDLLWAELVTAPLVLLLLVLVFRGLLPALLPVLVGAVSVTATTAVLGLLVTVTPVTVFALNITTALGFGLAVDYSLFMVTRFRTELGSGADVPSALRTTLATAGRTVFFSALAVSLCLAALLVFPVMFLRSFAYGGIAVALLSAGCALVVLPAALALLGTRLAAPAARDRGSRTRALGRILGRAWDRTARAVTRAPLLIALGMTAVLLALAAPFPQVAFGFLDDRALPAATDVRGTADDIREDFPALAATTLPVVLPGVGDSARDRAATARYAAALSAVPGVRRVDSAAGTFAHGTQQGPARPEFTAPGGTWLRATTDTDPYAPASLRTLEAVRALPAPVEPLVGGPTALLHDTRDAIAGRLPAAAVLLALSMLLLLFAFTGSILVPAKALLLTTLSMTATLGAMVFVFQQGHLRDLVGQFTPTGTTDLTMPILVFCIAFGLSMDYEVFLLSAIREEYLATGDNTAAVAAGVRRTGPLISCAAALIVVVFLGQMASSLVPLKMLGTGMVLTIALDVTVIRLLLAPALMHLAGPANWWSPAPLARWHARYGLKEA